MCISSYKKLSVCVGAKGGVRFRGAGFAAVVSRLTWVPGTEF